MCGDGEVAIQSRVFWLPKEGHADAEYEDAFALSPSAFCPFRAAVADGATESAFARTWATLLTSGWVAARGSDERDFFRSLPEWQQDWRSKIAPTANNLPWYAAAKAEEGAFAAFMGISINKEGMWQALAVGDCCLFHIQGERSTTWPLDTPDAFNNTPDLIPSIPGRPGGNVIVRQGTWYRGDAFVLATDAAAAWLMRIGSESIRALPPEDLDSRIERAREAGEIRNDDVTIIILEIGTPITGPCATDY